MYHYRISADGHIWQTQPEDVMLWHARHANYAGLSICCDLGPDQSPPPAQLDGLRTLLDYLCFHRPDFPASRQDVYGHGELTSAGNHTPCPGALLGWVKEYRNG
jgi:N-acetyl-anhydromuramyl-L-alanine amidase AmpD